MGTRNLQSFTQYSVLTSMTLNVSNHNGRPLANHFPGSSIFSKSLLNNYPTFDFDRPYFNDLSLGARVFTPIPAGIRNRRIGIIYSILTDTY